MGLVALSQHRIRVDIHYNLLVKSTQVHAELLAAKWWTAEEFRRQSANFRVHLRQR